MLRGREARTSPFVCKLGTHVAGTVRKLVHTKQIMPLKCAVEEESLQEQCTRCHIENRDHFAIAS